MFIKNAILAAALILFSLPLKAESKFLLIAYCKTPVAYVGGGEERTLFATARWVVENPGSDVAKYLLRALKTSKKKNLFVIQLERYIGLSCPENV